MEIHKRQFNSSRHYVAILSNITLYNNHKLIGFFSVLKDVHVDLINFQRSCELILDVINALPNVQLEPRGDADMNPTSTGPGRQLLLTACIEKEILPYSIQLLLSCFRVSAVGLTPS